MQILHINNVAKYGGRFTGFYMNEALGRGDSAAVAVWNRDASAPHVSLLPPVSSVGRRLTNLLMRIDGAVGLDGLSGFAGWKMNALDAYRNADVVHLHLVHNNANFSVLSLPHLAAEKPLVWTIHDQWPMTGGCTYSFDCEKWKRGCAPPCPYPRRRSLLRRHTPWAQWRVKKRCIGASNATLIVASKWMKERVVSSPILGRLDCHLIPFGVDLCLFSPSAGQAWRAAHGIGPSTRVVAFRGVGLSRDRVKGTPWLRKALQAYQPPDRTCLVILQDSAGFEDLSSRYQLVTPGWLDGADLAAALAASDVFVMPSLQEAFGLMAVEAMACGTPVIVGQGTSLPDVIMVPRGGEAVASGDVPALVAAIDKMLTNHELRLSRGREAREVAEEHYSSREYMARHLAVYRALVDARHVH